MAGDELRVLFLTIGPDSEPSSRFRAYQLVEPLRRHGIVASVRPRVGRRYVEMGYGLRRPAAPVRAAWAAGSFALRTLRRLRDLRDARRFDVVVLQKETLAFGMERLIPRLGLRVVYDFDDAVYATPAGEDGLGRRLRAVAERVAQRPRALPALLSRCSAVVAGSSRLAEFARDHNGAVHVVPTTVDTDAYRVRAVRRAGRLTVGWVGAPAGVSYLAPLRPVFQELARRHDLRLLVLGAGDFECPGVRVECRPFRAYTSRADEASDLAEIDVGIMPLPDDPFTAGKCALKAIQYMACGIPVVASPVGATPEVVEDGVTGRLASTAPEWLAALSQLLGDASLREQIGRAGRARAVAHYSLEGAAARWAALLRSVSAHREGAPGSAVRRGGRDRSRQIRENARSGERRLVEPSGIEPPTSALRTRRSPN